MTGVDIVALITNIGFPAGFSIVLLWMLSTKIETISENLKDVGSKVDNLSSTLDIVGEVRGRDGVIKLLQDIKDKLEKVEYLINTLRME